MVSIAVYCCHFCTSLCFLNVNCLYTWFVWITMKDGFSFSQSCSRLEILIVGKFIHAGTTWQPGKICKLDQHMIVVYSQ